jgi:hypothetical protein
MVIEKEIEFPKFVKDPEAVLDYAFDWKPYTNGREGAISDWLEDGETIQSHVITVSKGLTVEASAEANGIVTVWISGGTSGVEYTVSCHIVTDSTPINREDDRTIIIQCQEN